MEDRNTRYKPGPQKRSFGLRKYPNLGRQKHSIKTRSPETNSSTPNFPRRLFLPDIVSFSYYPDIKMEAPRHDLARDDAAKDSDLKGPHYTCTTPKTSIQSSMAAARIFDKEAHAVIYKPADEPSESTQNKPESRQTCGTCKERQQVARLEAAAAAATKRREEEEAKAWEERARSIRQELEAASRSLTSWREEEKIRPGYDSDGEYVGSRFPYDPRVHGRRTGFR